jgi:hypothetical protein
VSALDETREEIVAVRTASGVAFVLLQASEGLLSECGVHYSWDWALDGLSGAVDLDDVCTHVSALLY